MNLKRGLHHQLVDHLGLNIVSGKFKVGDTLPNEVDLGVEFGVSRTVIREAIKVLNEKGLVASRPKVGTQVQPRQRWNLLDADVLNWKYEAGPRDEFLRNLTEVRWVIEPAAAQLAAQRATDTEIAAIEGFYRQMVEVIDDNDKYIAVDLQFHTGIVRASHNELIEQIITTIRVALISSRKITIQVPDSSRAALPSHQAILEAIQQRKPAAARLAMETLIENTARDIERVIGPIQNTGKLNKE